MAVVQDVAPVRRGVTSEETKVIFASSLGTVFEWYDFFLFGSLATVIGQKFFTELTETAQLIFTLLVFAAGFFVRPLGALVFGGLGDMVGRKYTFLMTILIMGLSTVLVGVLPSYGTIGIAAPILLVGLRLLQGLALGGEYGGAATYVAEHAPHGRRGLYTSWIQTTATAGLLLSLIVILICRNAMTDADFNDWGWRIPFLVSALLLAVSLWIRLQLNESPVFKRMKAEGKASSRPLRDSFTKWPNLKMVLLALFGATAGEAVVWYTGQFYAMIFLTSTLHVAPSTVSMLIAAGLVLGTPFFLIFGWLSDRIGRKPIILAGCLLAVLGFFPVFQALTHFANPALEAAAAANPVTVVADPSECSSQFNPTGRKIALTSSCDIAKSALVKAGVPYANEVAPKGAVAQIRIGTLATVSGYDGTAADASAQAATFKASLTSGLANAHYPASADPAQINYVGVIAMLFILMLMVTMVYAPLAAMLVEMFPTSIRYTSMSLPYHLGNGWLGGFVPLIAVSIVAATGNIYAGLWYPVIVAAITFIVGMLFVRETKDVDIAA